MDLVTQNYNGRLVEFRQEPTSGDLWITAEQAAPILGLSGGN